MLKGFVKGAGLAGFGHLPGGPALYRYLTRQLMGTKATHVDKLCRVLPAYLRVWQETCGLAMEGLDLWVHEAGWTPLWGYAGHLLTGRGVTLTNPVAQVLERYNRRALDGVLGLDLPGLSGVGERRALLADQVRHDDVREAFEKLQVRLFSGVGPAAIPLAQASVDLSHSGGALEHLRPSILMGFLGECFRILRPGGVASHVFDHRDHLHHADRDWPFLSHLALPDWAYALWSGHSLGYHNRLSPTQVIELFETAGFQVIAVRRLTLPEGRYVPLEKLDRALPGLDRARLAAGRQTISDVDLRTAAAHYLFRKPI